MNKSWFLSKNFHEAKSVGLSGYIAARQTGKPSHHEAVSIKGASCADGIHAAPNPRTGCCAQISCLLKVVRILISTH